MTCMLMSAAACLQVGRGTNDETQRVCTLRVKQDKGDDFYKDFTIYLPYRGLLLKEKGYTS